MGGATPSTPHSPTILVFHQLANRWKDLLAKKVKGKDGNEGKEGRGRKKSSDTYIEWWANLWTLKSELVQQLHLFPLSVEDVPSACVCV